MNKDVIIHKTVDYVKSCQSGEGTGHDWWHTYRVWQLAKKMAQLEKADMCVVELASLLHDIADFKFNNGDDKAGARVARQWLNKLDVPPATIDHVCHVVDNVSFKGANVKSSIKTIEGMIVQDADRLDALGAIGIARTFAYGGNKSREIHNPDYKITLHNSFEEYKNNTGTSIGHFYEKLLLLKDKMNTKTGRELAEKRHQYMEQFLTEFYKEWDGDDN